MQPTSYTYDVSLSEHSVELPTQTMSIPVYFSTSRFSGAVIKSDKIKSIELRKSCGSKN